MWGNSGLKFGTKLKILLSGHASSIEVALDYKIRQVFLVLNYDRAWATASLHGGVVPFSAGNSITEF